MEEAINSTKYYYTAMYCVRISSFAVTQLSGVTFGLESDQRRRAIEALEALPPDSMATLVNSLQNRVNSITLCKILNANTGKIVLVTL